MELDFNEEPIITAIEPKRRNMSAIYINGRFAVKIDSETLILNHIKIGMKISEEELNDLIQKSNESRSNEKALNLLSFRDHSKSELVKKISRVYGEESALKAAEKMENIGLINDVEFAKKYVKDLSDIKKYGKQRIEQELFRKGLDREIIEEALNGIDINPEEKIHEIIEKKFSNKILSEKGKKQTINALLRMGYSWSDIKKVIKEKEEDNDI